MYNPDRNEYFVVYDVDTNLDGQPDHIYALRMTPNGAIVRSKILDVTVKGTPGISLLIKFKMVFFFPPWLGRYYFVMYHVFLFLLCRVNESQCRKNVYFLSSLFSKIKVPWVRRKRIFVSSDRNWSSSKAIAEILYNLFTRCRAVLPAERSVWIIWRIGLYSITRKLRANVN